MAELVDEGQARGEIATPERNLRRGPDVRAEDIGRDAPKTLPELGIDRRRLIEARKLTKVPEQRIIEAANVDSPPRPLAARIALP